MSDSRNHRGFSLLQMIVVVAIVAVLAAILLSGVSRMLIRSEDVRCLANLRMLGGALLTYVVDHDGYVPPYVEPVPPALPKDRYWHMRLWSSGYVEDRDVFFCPSFAPRNFNDLQRVFNKKWNNDIGYTYGMREWSDPSVTNYSESVQKHKKLSMIDQPSDFFLLTDSILVVNSGNLSQGYVVRPVSSANWRIRLSHDDQANAFFADGRVGKMNREFIRTIHVRQPRFTQQFGFSVWPE